ncbi:MAG: histidinol-phosphate transaminase [Pseudomonadota bacterium]|nr:MAG: histidinol-phosphate transaminase [Pseudomonadota bacterium]
MTTTTHNSCDPAFDFAALSKSGVRALQPYQPGKPLDELEREYGIRNAVKLASNENPLGPGPLVLERIRGELGELARYPDGNGFALKQALSAKLGVGTAQLTLGNGSNDVLELVARAFVDCGDEVIFSQHAFAVYPIVTQAVGARAVVTPAADWGQDLDAMRAAIGDRTRLVFVANPNNPTGTWLTGAALQNFLDAVPSQVLVVLDEAYFEYAADGATGATGYPSGIAWLSRYPNLIVTRTFSKAYGLAGLRIGYGVSHPQIADLLNRVRQPFNVNSLALAAASAALEDTDHLAHSLQANAHGMAQLTGGFESLGLEFIHSAGNFVSVRVAVRDGMSGLDVYEALLRQGVIVRPVANYGMPEHLRITVGTAAENARVLDALKTTLVVP